MKTAQIILNRFIFLFGFLLTVLLTLGANETFSQVVVSAGYNDEPRNGIPFSPGSGQPSPWCGSINTTFYGDTNAALAYDPDEDAILLQNLGSAPASLTAASVAGYNLFTFDSITNSSIPINPGSDVILAGPDGSDVLAALVPISLTINGVNYSHADVATANAPDGVLDGAMPWIGGCESIPWTAIFSTIPIGAPVAISLGVGSGSISTNGFNLILNGPVGSDYEIEASTNLTISTNWQPVLYFYSTNSPFYFSAPVPTNSSQIFYRAAIAD